MPSQTVSSGPIIGSTGSDWLEGSKAHATCMGLFLSSGCFGFAVSSLFGGVSR